MLENAAQASSRWLQGASLRSGPRIGLWSQLSALRREAKFWCAPHREATNVAELPSETPSPAQRHSEWPDVSTWTLSARSCSFDD
jgi:hypothetical protein